MLHFAAEPAGWMNLYRYVDGKAEQVTDLEAELAGPDWQFGYSTYEFLPGGDILAIARSSCRDELIRIGRSGAISTIELPYTEMNSLSVDGDRVLLLGAGPKQPAQIVELDLDGSIEVLRNANPNRPDPEDVSIPRHIEFPTTGDRTAFGTTTPRPIAPSPARPASCRRSS